MFQCFCYYACLESLSVKHAPQLLVQSLIGYSAANLRHFQCLQTLLDRLFIFDEASISLQYQFVSYSLSPSFEVLTSTFCQSRTSEASLQ